MYKINHFQDIRTSVISYRVSYSKWFPIETTLDVSKNGWLHIMVACSNRVLQKPKRNFLKTLKCRTNLLVREKSLCDHSIRILKYWAILLVGSWKRPLCDSLWKDLYINTYNILLRSKTFLYTKKNNYFLNLYCHEWAWLFLCIASLWCVGNAKAK